MFGYTLTQMAIVLLVAAIVGMFAWYHLSFRWSVWKGRKIAQQQQADEAEKLKREMDEIRPEFPNASDRELEKIVRGRRMQRVIAAMEERNGMHLSTKRTQMGSVTQRADRPVTAHAVRNEPPKFNDTHRSPLEDVAIAAMLSQQQQRYDEVEMGRPDDPVVEKFDARHHNVPSAGPEYHWPASKETPQENEVKGKGNDTTTGNVGSTRSSGHRADRDDSSGAQEGWGSERLQGGSGWGGGSFGSSSRDDSRDDSRDYGGGDSGSSSSSSND